MPSSRKSARWWMIREARTRSLHGRVHHLLDGVKYIYVMMSEWDASVSPLPPPRVGQGQGDGSHTLINGAAASSTSNDAKRTQHIEQARSTLACWWALGGFGVRCSRVETNAQSFVPVDTQPLINSRALYSLFCKHRAAALGANSAHKQVFWCDSHAPIC
jgi:hypothetical protein